MSRATGRFVPRSIDGAQFVWTEMTESLMAILQFREDHGKVVGPVEIRNPEGAVDLYGSLMFNRYGASIDYVHESVLFEDGAAFLTATTKEWRGTFSSHDDIRIRHYGLVPK